MSTDMPEPVTPEVWTMGEDLAGYDRFLEGAPA